MTWIHTTVGEVMTLQRGFDITRAQQRVGDVPVISSGGISSHHDVAMARGPGVIIGRKGTLGTVFYAPKDFWPHDTTLWVKDFKGNLPRFVYYFLKMLDVRGLDVGSANPALNRNHVHPLSIRWPSEPGEQNAIAAVLGALDDKIAANTALAQTADDLATAFFARAAGSAALASSYGVIASVGGGGTPSTRNPDLWGGMVSWATPTDVTALSAPFLSATTRRITEAGLQACASPLYPKGSILMTSRATIGSFAIAETPMAVNQGFIVVNPNDSRLDMWLFYEMRSRLDDYRALANGATFPELSRGRFKALPVRLAETEVVMQFGEDVRPLVAVARHSQKESAVLAELRDTLLPALMSGRLRVKDAERQVEDAV